MMRSHRMAKSGGSILCSASGALMKFVLYSARMRDRFQQWLASRNTPPLVIVVGLNLLCLVGSAIVVIAVVSNNVPATPVVATQLVVVSATQIDLFYGDLITSFAGGVRYGDRKLAARHLGGTNFCQK
jgi:hypothetical protein